MKQCSAEAMLLITKTVKDTSTNIARERIFLRCALEEGHPGAHEDRERNEHWEAAADKRVTVLRHEDSE